MDIVYNINNKKIITFYDTTGERSATGSMPRFQILKDATENNVALSDFTLWSWITQQEARRFPKHFFDHPEEYSVIENDLGIPIGVHNGNKTFIIKEPIIISPDQKIPIVWSGMFFNSISYSLINRKMLFGLQDRGFDIYACAIRSSDYTEIPECDKKRLEDMDCYSLHLDKENAIRVYCYLPIERTPPALYNISYTMMESQSVHPMLVNTLNNYNNEIWFPCFIGNTFINTDQRYIVPIQSVKYRPKILSHNNRYCNIKNKSIRKYSGELTVLSTYICDDHLVCTPDHPYLIYNIKEDKSITELPTIKRASELNRKDWLFYPRQLSSQSISEINLIDYGVNLSANKKFKIKKNKLFILEKRNFYNHIRDEEDYYEATVKGSGEINATVPINCDMMSILSTFLSNRELRFTEKNSAFADEFINKSKKVFGDISISKFKASNCITIEITPAYRIVLESLLLFLLDEEDEITKHIKFDILNNRSLLEKAEFIKNIFNQNISESTDIRCRISGKKFVYYIIGFLLDLGIVPRLSHVEHKHKHLDCTYVASISISEEQKENFDNIINGKITQNNAVYCEDYIVLNDKILFKVIKSEKREVSNINVYNFEITKDNTYLANFIATHNCNFNVDGFRKAGVKKKIYHMPLAYDDNLYNNNAGKINWDDLNFTIINNNSDSFPKKPHGKIFLSVFRYSYRKGPDVLIKAFRKAFRKSDNVSLVIFSRHYLGNIKTNDIDTVGACYADMQKWFDNDDNAAPIYWSYDFLPESKMPSLFAAADCLISTSRGEGFGLPPIEAAACGVPIIAPNHSAFADYMNNDRGFIIETDGYENCGHLVWENGSAKYIGDNPEWTIWITEAFADQSFPIFGERAFNQTAELMRFVYENTDIAKSKADKMKKYVNDNYTWDKCIDRLANRLNDIQNYFRK